MVVMRVLLAWFVSLFLASLLVAGCNSGPSGAPGETPDDLAIVELPDTNVVIGDRVQLELKGASTEDVTWVSSNPTVATVNQTGLVTALAAGSSTITATLKSDTRISASIVITVTPVTLTLSPTTASLITSEEISLHLTITPERDVPLEWNTTCGTISATERTATYTAPTTLPDTGECTVTVTGNPDGEPPATATATITILAPPQPADVVITPTTATLQVDQDATFTVSMTNVENPTFTWTTTCGTINATELTATYTAPTTTGTCNLKVKHDPSDSEASATVTITPGPADLTTSTVIANPTTLTADGTSTATITVTLKDQYGNPLTTSGGTITFDTATLVGTIGAVTDNQDGTYTATYTAGTTHGTETIKAKLDDQPLATTSVTLIVFSMIHAGKWHSLALDTNGNAWAWGRDPYGQLGDGGTNTDKATPVPVDMPPDVSFTDVHAGGSHSLALDTNGNAWAWGDDGYGQLGDGGDNTDKATPVQVTMPTDVSFTDVHAGGSHSLALDTNGNAWAWGDDGYGQLGDGGTNTDKATPVEVSMPDGVTFETIHAGTYYSLALDTNGNAWAWGRDRYGQLGDGGTNTNQATPVPVDMP